MGADQTIDWTRAAAAALDWWCEAGVDVLVADEPFDWLDRAAPLARAPATATPALPGVLPDTLNAFATWRLGPEAPEASWGIRLIPLSGPATADLMVMVDCPERDDRDSLLGGAAGRLFDRMMAAVGRTRADTCLVSVCAARPVAARMPRETEARLAEIARHHVALVAPARLLVLGNAASRATLSTDLAESRGSLRVLNHEAGKTTAAMASFHPRFLLEKPACKADAWRDLQMLMGATA